MRAFFPPRSSSALAFEETVKRSRTKRCNVKDAAENAAKSLRDAFDRVSVSIKSSIGARRRPWTPRAERPTQIVWRRREARRSLPRRMRLIA